MTELRDILNCWQKRMESSEVIVPDWTIDELESTVRLWLQTASIAPQFDSRYVIPVKKVEE